MRFSNYLVEGGGRSKIITLDEWLVIAKKKHMKTLTKLVKNNDCLYRGRTSLSSDKEFGYVDPKKGYPRESANTENYYTMWIDNSPKWKAYPKRSRSLICTNDFESAFGSKDARFIILPEDNSNIGVCDSVDFWAAFSKTSPFRGDLSEFNSSFKGCYLSLTGKILADNPSFGELQDAIDLMDEEIKDNPEDAAEFYFIGEMQYQGIPTVRELFDTMFDPKANNMKVIKSHQPLPTGRRECWTDGKSLMLNSKVFRYEQQAWDVIKKLVK